MRILHCFLSACTMSLQACFDDRHSPSLYVYMRLQSIICIIIILHFYLQDYIIYIMSSEYHTYHYISNDKYSGLV